MQDALSQVQTALTALQAAQVDLDSEVATVDPTWAAVQAALTAAGWTPPAEEVSSDSAAIPEA